MNSNRYGQAQSAYREVQERHEDIRRIEKTLTELAQLFNDVSYGRRLAGVQHTYVITQMSVLVEQQEEQINVIETTAAAVEKDTELG